MELLYKSKNGQFQIKFDAKDQIGMIEQISDFQSIFEQNMACGLCNSTDVYFNVRETKDGDKYYERKCSKCYAAFPYHQNKKGGTLYTSHKDRWAKYNPNNNPSKDEEVFTEKKKGSK